MNNKFNKFMFYFKKIINIIITWLSMLSIRSKNIYIFGAWFGEKFSDNPKYLFLEAEKDINIRSIWITKNINTYNSLKNNNYEVYMYNSLKGIIFQLRAKYFFTCTAPYDVNFCLLGGATNINLWHGIPLKKIMFDDKINHCEKNSSKQNTVIKYIKSLLLIPIKKELVVSSSNVITNIYTNAFKLEKEKILEMGQPRNDVFFLDYLEDKDFPEKYKNNKIILYMPTHRNKGETEINLKKLFDFDLINQFCKKNNYLFLIKKHFYHRNENENLIDFSNIEDITNEDIDSQMLLKYTDILITDYSSCYIDYLLLNRPILFYNHDYANYLLNDRELYFPYDQVTPGAKVITFNELFQVLKSIINDNKDEFSEARNKVKDLFYSKENQKVVGSRILDSAKRGFK